jgi:DNA-binding beta-propeller fold protein YncE
MKTVAGRCGIALFLILLVCLSPSALAQQLQVVSIDTSAASSAPSRMSTLPVPNSAVLHAEFVGSYGSDGRFLNPAQAHELDTPARIREDAALAELPPSVQLRCVERVVDDLIPPAHTTKRVTARSLFGNIRDSAAHFAYGGWQKVLQSPTHVTTDSQQRLIVSDPANAAVHVFSEKDSFRIQGGGESRRLQHPIGIGVDADDNIYVADAVSSLILVYDRQGHFLRELGKFRDENLFANPTAIAIDQTEQRLYVLDSPMNELVVLDLTGRVVRRIGGPRHTGGVRFDMPTELAVRDNTIVVLDACNSRLQVLDIQGHLRNAFKFRNITNLRLPQIGLALDSAGNIYVTDFASPNVMVFHPDGRQLGFLHSSAPVGLQMGYFSGLWVDATGRIYVADLTKARVHVFQSASSRLLTRASQP